MADEKETVRRATRVYEALLRLYPRSHRREYGPLMVQLYRDQCRAVCRRGSGWALCELWLGVSRDLAVSAVREHLTEQTKRMKNLPPQKLSLILFAMAIGAALVSCSLALGQPGVAVGLAYLSALVLLVRAIVEWQRPTTEWSKGAAWGLAILIAYGFVMPVWGKVHLAVNPVLVTAPMFLNVLVPLVRAGLRLASPRS